MIKVTEKGMAFIWEASQRRVPNSWFDAMCGYKPLTMSTACLLFQFGFIEVDNEELSWLLMTILYKVEG